jgi:hypothetical protein
VCGWVFVEGVAAMRTMPYPVYSSMRLVLASRTFSRDEHAHLQARGADG